MLVLTAEEMQNIDEYTMKELGISRDVLMEKAALSVADEIGTRKNPKVVCVCGIGNNGGDGIAVARILLMRGISVTVYLCSEPDKCKESIKHQLDIYCKAGGKILSKAEFDGYDVIVDAIFGIGLNRPVSEKYVAIIEKINNAKKQGAYVYALDIPSGVCTNTGRILGTSVHADETIAFAYAKRGHFLYPAKNFVGKLSVKDVGIHHAFTPYKDSLTGRTYVQYEECPYPVIPKEANKGSNGRILIIAGSEAMNGACYLSAYSAFCTGAGLVEIYTAESNLETLKTMLPEAILHGHRSKEEELVDLLPVLERADAVVCGPGLSTSPFAHACVEFVLKHCRKPLVLDADAINCIAEVKDLLYNHVKMNPAKVVLTPHPKELSRLLQKDVKEILDDYANIVCNTAKELGIILVGKGAATIVADETNFYVNNSGNEGMATAGSGDVLTGIAAVLLAKEEVAFEAVCKAVYYHGCAGDLMAEKVGRISLMAHDLSEAIRIFLKR